MDTLQIGTMQRSYFSKASKVNKRVSDDDTLMSKEAFFAKIDRSLQQAKEGKVYSMQPGESLSAFLKRIENV